MDPDFVAVQSTDQPEFTADQIVEAIAAALKARDIKAVPGLIRLLALQDPEGAQLMLDAISAAQAINAWAGLGVEPQ